MKKLKELNWNKWIAIFVFISLVLSIVYAAVQLATLGDGAIAPGEKIAADYRLMIVQCILGIVVLFLPSIIGKQLKIEIPSMMYLIFIIFLYCSIYLGEVRSFYYLIPHWDTILHTFSGAMLGALGFSLVNLLNNNDHVKMSLSPLFVALFACCFAVTLGVLWEIYEFAVDSLLGMNMQKTMLEDGTALLGNAAVADTMKDLIVDFIGALTMSIIGYISLTRGQKWLEHFEFKKSTDK